MRNRTKATTSSMKVQEGLGSLGKRLPDLKVPELRPDEYAIAMEQSFDGIAVAHMNGNIRYVNRAWAEMHGYSAADLVGRHLRVFHTQEQREDQVIPFTERLMAEGSDREEIRHARKHGTIFSALMTAAVMRRGRSHSSCIPESCTRPQ